LKHKIFSPGVLINLAALRGAVTETETDVVIDASTKLDTLATDPLTPADVCEMPPGLCDHVTPVSVTPSSSRSAKSIP
jgi:hypothetical protein